jgi:hypothetical protein
LSACFPIFAHRSSLPVIKKPRPTKGAGANARNLFSGMFNVARNPVTKRHLAELRPFAGVVNTNSSRHAIVTRRLIACRSSSLDIAPKQPLTTK